MPAKEEFPPLLKPGFHGTTLCQLCHIAVLPFQPKKSSTRPELMCNLQTVIRTLIEAGIKGEIWVGNSFVTEKINPEDVDLFLWVDGYFFDNATQHQRDVMQWVHGNLKQSHGCDTKLFVNYEKDHPEFGTNDMWRSMCQTIFGFYHPDGPNVYEMKGIGLLKLPECITDECSN